MENLNREATQLLIKFSDLDNAHSHLQEIVEHLPLASGWVFFLQNGKEPNEIFISFNVFKAKLKECVKLPNVIVAHRKKEYNTIFTINSLNALQKQITGLDTISKDWSMPFDNYRNSLILVRDEGLDIIPTFMYSKYEIK